MLYRVCNNVRVTGDILIALRLHKEHPASVQVCNVTLRDIMQI